MMTKIILSVTLVASTIAAVLIAVPLAGAALPVVCGALALLVGGEQIATMQEIPSDCTALEAVLVDEINEELVNHNMLDGKSLSKQLLSITAGVGLCVVVAPILLVFAIKITIILVALVMIAGLVHHFTSRSTE